MQTHTPGPWILHPIPGLDPIVVDRPVVHPFLGQCPLTLTCPDYAANLARAVTCVNACEGMPDPAQAVALARDAIRRLLRHVPPAAVGSCEWNDFHVARRALIALGDLG